MILTLAISGLEVLKWIGYILVALFCLMLMVILHELGHYTFGKIFKFKINEFAIGFGPKLFSKTNKKTGEVFSIRMFPFGGFCAFGGEDDESKDPHDFNNRPIWQRIIVLFAGAGFNFLSAFIVITIFFSAYGEYFPVVGEVYQHVEYVDEENYQIIEDSQQLLKGDVILSINGKEVYSMLDATRLSELIADSDDNLTVVVLRAGEKKTLEVQKQYYLSYTDSGETDENGDKILVEKVSKSKGLGMALSNIFSAQKLSFGKALGQGARFGYDVLRVTGKSLKLIFNGTVSVSKSVGGTATSISILAYSVRQGFHTIVGIFCIFSVSIGIMNVMPLPALDGARIVFAIIEGIRRKPINRKVEGMVHFVGLIVLLALAILLDLLHFFG
ncbi:MAG: site-2 protease family protein [Clostridia bacterium]|nr:site-2 protease family protein [Clostridia bacterium]